MSQNNVWVTMTDLAEAINMKPHLFRKHLIALGLKDLFTNKPTDIAISGGFARLVTYPLNLYHPFPRRITVKKYEWNCKVLMLPPFLR